MASFALLIGAVTCWASEIIWAWDDRYPLKTYLAINKELPENSKLRKIIKKILPVKETKTNPYLYIKVVPYFISVIILACVVVLYIVYAIIPNVLDPVLSHPACIWTSLGLIAFALLHKCVINLV